MDYLSKLPAMIYWRSHSSNFYGTDTFHNHTLVSQWRRLLLSIRVSTNEKISEGLQNPSQPRTHSILSSLSHNRDSYVWRQT